MGRQANLTLQQHGALIDLFDRISEASDIPTALAAGSPNARLLGDLVSYQFYPTTPGFPFYEVIKTSLMTIVMANGTNTERQGVTQAASYSTNAVIGGGFAGVSAAVGLYAAQLTAAYVASVPYREILTVFCGHSYGAAAAFNAARLLQSTNRNYTIEAVGWGGPKWAFSSNIPDSVDGLVETNWALDRDIVPCLPPLLLQVPQFYSLIPLPVSTAMLRYYNPVGNRGLDVQGVTSDLSINPWRLVVPRGVVDMVNGGLDEAVNNFHGSSLYRTAIAAYVARYDPPRSPPTDLPFRTHSPSATSPQQIAIATGTSLNYLKSIPVIVNPANLQSDVATYRVRRKRRKYYVCRGSIYLGQAESKVDAKTIAKGARQMASANGYTTPDELSGNDQLVVVAYNLLFRTILI